MKHTNISCRFNWDNAMHSSLSLFRRFGEPELEKNGQLCRELKSPPKNAGKLSEQPS